MEDYSRIELALAGNSKLICVVPDVGYEDGLRWVPQPGTPRYYLDGQPITEVEARMLAWPAIEVVDVFRGGPGGSGRTT